MNRVDQPDAPDVIDDLAQGRAVNGVFWVPGRESESVQGHIVIRDSMVRLELSHWLTGLTFNSTEEALPGGEIKRTEVMSDPAKVGIVHGTMDDTGWNVTLINCLTVFRGKGQHLLALYMLCGSAHVFGSNEKFDGARVSIANLSAWLDASEYSLEEDVDGVWRPMHRPTIEYEGVLTGGEHVSLVVNDQGSESKKIWFELINLQWSDWSDIDRKFLSPLCTFLTLCVHEECFPLWVQVRTLGGEWLHVVGNFAPVPTIKYRPRPLLDFADIGLRGVVNWLNNVERVGPLATAIAGSVVAKRDTVETQLIELTTAAEGLHSRLFPERVRMSPAEALRIRNTCVSAILDAEQRHKDAVDGLLKYLHELGYKQRLLDLAELAERYVPGLVGRRKKWGKQVYDIRNIMAHRRGGFLDDKNLDRYRGAAISLRWVLVVGLFDTIEMEPTLLRAKVLDNDEYRYFIGVEAPRLLPDVYSK